MGSAEETQAGERRPEPAAGDRERTKSRSGAAFAELARALAEDAAVAGRRLRDWASGPALTRGRALTDALALRARALYRWLPRLRFLTVPVTGQESWRLRGWIKQLGRPAIIVAALLLCLPLALIVWIARDAPFREVLAASREPAILLEAGNGDALAQAGGRQGEYVKLADFPEHLVQAVLSVEDRRFHDHSGIDFRGIARAALRNMTANEVVEGGSTITQQLVKILHLERERTFKRKAQEAMLALLLEWRLSKEEILTRYLNSIYLGAGATGMPAAARAYFDKAVEELSVAESAMLAGLIRAPSQLNPLNNPEGAKARAQLVLASMREAGFLDEEQAAAALAEAPRLEPSEPDALGPWFADWVGEEARKVAGSFRGTVRVRTTLVPDLQALAQRTVSEMLDDEGGKVGAGEAALVAMQPNGAVLAMVGGRDYEANQFNRAVQARRQPGSTFKLFVYYAALRNGFEVDDRIADEPMDIDGYRPENFDGEYAGRVSLAQAFGQSLNAAAVKLALDVGLNKVVAAAQELGIDAPLSETPSLALGTSEVTLLDLTAAYASVRAGRAPVEPWGIAGFRLGEEKRDFRVGSTEPPKVDLSAHQEALVQLLQMAVERGTGREARLDGFAAGKTGTSQNHRDAWFVGFNEHLVVGVWVGNDDGSPMRGVTGGELPARIWKRFMSEAMALAVARSEDQPVATGGQMEAAASGLQAPACNLRACSRAYRSFRASDCTYQPYRGRRKLCER